ncbi:MAG: nuclear transport factor 2 family protein [Acidobacteria bacterium]|nr:nuclear transport factor 2 family protein [Acidobacteriota bacterium]
MRQEKNVWIVAVLAVLVLSGPASIAGESPGAAVDRFFGAYRNASLEGMLAGYAPNAVFEDVNQRHYFEGTEQLEQMLGQLVAMHHKMDVKEKRRVVDGNTVVVEYDYVGTLNGAVLGQIVGKEGCPDLEYTLPTTSWYEVEDGKIVHQRDFVDWATFLELRERMLTAGSEN